MMRAIVLSCVAAAAVVAALHEAVAADAPQSEECGAPCLEYSGYARLDGDWYNPTTDSGDWLDIHPKSETEIRLTPFEGLSVFTNITTEPVIDAEPGQDSIFSDIGTYAEILQIEADLGDLLLYGGKIHPVFGRAWDLTPGLHGTDVAENYEVSERIGGGAGFGFEAAQMLNVLSVSAFTADRTILSESLFTNRGRTTLDDGGAGNAEGLASVAVALDGCLGAEIEKCYEDGSFGYQIAALYQKGGHDSDGNELGFVASLNKAFALGEDTTLRLFGESAWFRNYDGGPDNALALTGSGALQMGALTYSLAYSQIKPLASNGEGIDEYEFDATVLCELGESISVAGESWAIGAGYAFDHADGEGSNIFGLRLLTEFEGVVPLAR